MLISTANIMGTPLMRQKKVLLDVKTVLSRSTVVGWQEISKPRYKDAVRSTYAHDWQVCELATEVPISVRKSQLKVLKSGHKLTHHGRAGASPNRYISWAYVETVDRQPVRFVVINTHYVSGAWNNKRKLFKAWRKRMWLVHNAQLRQLVLDAHESGFSVLVVGDFNRVSVEKFHPKQHWVSNGGIDKIFWLEGKHGPQFSEVSAVLRTNLYSDHDLKTARISLH